MSAAAVAVLVLAFCFKETRGLALIGLALFFGLCLFVVLS